MSPPPPSPPNGDAAHPVTFTCVSPEPAQLPPSHDDEPLPVIVTWICVLKIPLSASTHAWRFPPTST
jgi:hypothetical protein